MVIVSAWAFKGKKGSVTVKRLELRRRQFAGCETGQYLLMSLSVIVTILRAANLCVRSVKQEPRAKKQKQKAG